MKHRISAICIALLMLVCMLPAPSIAAAETEALVKDNSNVYEGMGKSYKKGYIPAVSDDKVRIVLPLLLDSASGVNGIYKDRITVTAELADSNNSPFIFGNYSTQYRFKEHGVNDGKDKATAILVDLSIPLKAERKNGTYLLVLKADYYTDKMEAKEQKFNMYVTIDDEQDTSDVSTKSPSGEGAEDLTASTNTSADPTPEASGEPASGSDISGGAEGGGEASVNSPRLMISEFQISPDPVQAGKEFTLSITLKNTSSKSSIKNLVLTYGGETTDIMASGNSNSMLIKSIGAGASTKVNLGLKARLEAEPKPQKVLIKADGEDGSGGSVAAELEVLVDIRQPNRLEYDYPVVPQEVYASDTISISLNILNKGKGALSNVSVTLDAPGLITEGSAFLGSIEPGTNKNADLSVFVGSKDMTSMAEAEMVDDDPGEGTETATPVPEETTTPEQTPESEDLYQGEKYGYTAGKIIITYEDNYGQEFKEEIDINTNINEPMIGGEQEEEVEPEKASQWWISLLIAGLVIAGIVAYIIIRRKKQQKDISVTDDDDSDWL